MHREATAMDPLPRQEYSGRKRRVDSAGSAVVGRRSGRSGLGNLRGFGSFGDVGAGMGCCADMAAGAGVGANASTGVDTTAVTGGSGGGDGSDRGRSSVDEFAPSWIAAGAGASTVANAGVRHFHGSSSSSTASARSIVTFAADGVECAAGGSASSMLRPRDAAGASSVLRPRAADDARGDCLLPVRGDAARGDGLDLRPMEIMVGRRRASKRLNFQSSCPLRKYMYSRGVGFLLYIRPIHVRWMETSRSEQICQVRLN